MTLVAIVLLIDNDAVRAVLTPAMTIAALERAYADLARGEAVCRPRIDIRIPTSDPARCYQWGTMEGGSTAGYFAIRMKSDIVLEQTYAGVRTQEKYCGEPGRYCGLVLLFEVETGLPVAMLNDGYLQHERVAADGAIGTRLMAREDARTARHAGLRRHGALACRGARHRAPDRRLRVFSPTREHRERFAREVAERFGIDARAVDDPREVYRGADILIACTDSAVPVIRGDWLEPGMHVISVGGRPDDAARARFDRKLRLGTAPAPVGRPELATSDEYLGYVAAPSDPLWSRVRGGARAAQVTGDGTDVMYADVIAGQAPARRSPEEITYSERGNVQGVQFYAVASAVYAEADEARTRPRVADRVVPAGHPQLSIRNRLQRLQRRSLEGLPMTLVTRIVRMLAAGGRDRAAAAGARASLPTTRC